MVHLFRYVRNEKPYFLMWDVESASLSVIDYAAFLYAKKRYASLTKQEEEAFFAISQKEIDELTKEFSDKIDAEFKIKSEEIMKL